MNRSEQHLQGYRHGWREAIAYVLAHAAEMNDPSAQAALRACAHGMGIEKHMVKKVFLNPRTVYVTTDSKTSNAPNNAPQPPVEFVEIPLRYYYGYILPKDCQRGE